VMSGDGYLRGAQDTNGESDRNSSGICPCFITGSPSMPDSVRGSPSRMQVAQSAPPYTVGHDAKVLIQVYGTIPRSQISFAYRAL
jgi:hypothetical protein